MDTIRKSAQNWLSDFFDPQVREEVSSLMETDVEELKDRFYKNLEFGTGGMRGVMGVGTNRINKYTLGKSTQGGPWGLSADSLLMTEYYLATGDTGVLPYMKYCCDGLTKGAN